MKKKITKEYRQHLEKLVRTKGYWSDEVFNYIQTFDYKTKEKAHNIALNVHKNS